MVPKSISLLCSTCTYVRYIYIYIYIYLCFRNSLVCEHLNSRCIRESGCLHRGHSPVLRGSHLTISSFVWLLPIHIWSMKAFFGSPLYNIPFQAHWCQCYRCHNAFEYASTRFTTFLGLVSHDIVILPLVNHLQSAAEKVHPISRQLATRRVKGLPRIFLPVLAGKT